MIEALHRHVGLPGADRVPPLGRQRIAARRPVPKPQRAVADKFFVGLLEMIWSRYLRLAEHGQFVGLFALRVAWLWPSG
jgi:hypothetical protein